MNEKDDCIQGLLYLLLSNIYPQKHINKMIN